MTKHIAEIAADDPQCPSASESERFEARLKVLAKQIERLELLVASLHDQRRQNSQNDQNDGYTSEHKGWT